MFGMYFFIIISPENVRHHYNQSQIEKNSGKFRKEREDEKGDF